MWLCAHIVIIVQSRKKKYMVDVLFNKDYVVTELNGDKIIYQSIKLNNNRRPES